MVIISGGDSQANVGIARSFSNTVFIDLGQPLPCVTDDGQPDPSGTCEGGEFGVPSNYTAVDFAVEDGAYLAGVLAAAASRDDRLGIISGAGDCAGVQPLRPWLRERRAQRRPRNRHRAGLPRRRRSLRLRRPGQRQDLRQGLHRRLSARRAAAGRARRDHRHDRGRLRGGQVLAIGTDIDVAGRPTPTSPDASSPA